MPRRPPPAPAIPDWADLRFVTGELPPPLNHLYIQDGHGGKFRNPKVQRWQQDTAAVIQLMGRAGGWPVTSSTKHQIPLTVAVLFTAPNIYQWDLDGRLKVLFDALAEAVRVDDRYIVYSPLYKVRGPVGTALLARPHRPEDLYDGVLLHSLLTDAGLRP